MVLLNVVKKKKQDIHIHVLPNGLTIVHRYTKSPIAYCGLLIKAGTRDELPHEGGLAHFTEHMLFKGTTRHTARYILSKLDDRGGELNAYTSRENTILHATCFRQHAREAIELLFEIAFESTFPEREIRKEAEVIRDEILSYKDSPSDALLDEFDELLTGGHPIGRNILGTLESVSSFRREHFIGFTSELYRPERILLFFSGQIKPESIAQWAESITAGYQPKGPARERSEAPTFHHFNIVRQHLNHQCNAALGILTPGVHHADYPTLALLNHMLGGPGLNNILILNIREKFGLTYELESFFNVYSDCGFLGIYFGTDKESLKKVLKLIHQELQKLIDTPLTERRLMKAKVQFMGHYLIQQEHALNQIINAARSWELFQKIEDTSQIWEKISGITPHHIQEIVSKYLNPDGLSTLIFESV
ncbi:peptidase M16 [Thermaurantimonas aggregans]|uniref:Peptidase M16 n=1 Tax=Thermaurantimonas aggregans TaxID=2173829 RepID=A0A401XJV0_9FLAO|nr:pitrilysin family protein [Thermaurantimonas aggregans]MCX8148934.1 insulinase family protein [Thermaurantimonas aggregans]GCD77251.1 peptidase M16 [Thermaurantimonas aggregans]